MFVNLINSLFFKEEQDRIARARAELDQALQGLQRAKEKLEVMQMPVINIPEGVTIPDRFWRN